MNALYRKECCRKCAVGEILRRMCSRRDAIENVARMSSRRYEEEILQVYSDAAEKCSKKDVAEGAAENVQRRRLMQTA